MKLRRYNPARVSNGVVFLVFVLGIGPLAFYLWGIHAIRRAELWPTTEAVVTTSKDVSVTHIVETDEGTQGATDYRTAFAFAYTVAGNHYVSTQFCILGQPRPHVITEQYPVGRHFAARYDPDNPGTAIVEPGSLNPGLLYGSILTLGLAAAFLIYNFCQK